MAVVVLVQLAATTGSPHGTTPEPVGEPEPTRVEATSEFPSPPEVARDVLETPIPRVPVKSATVRKIIAAARAQEGDFYDASYQRISYPNGDVPKGSGACTDVVIRALRRGGYDLQKLVHDDMTQNFRAYSDRWRLGRTDTNIDHRRVPNLMVYFRRHGLSLPLGTSGRDLKTWQPGDIVCWQLEGGRSHIGIISDGIGPRDLPLVVHNGWVCVEQDCLDTWVVTGHFRYPRR